MEKALKTVLNRVPSAVPNLNLARDALIKKFREKTINNITDFRKLSKIATSISNVGVKESKARSAILDIFDITKKTNIHDVYAEQFETRYDERKISLNIDSVSEYLDATIESDDEASLGKALKAQLLKLKELIDRVLQASNAI